MKPAIAVLAILVSLTSVGHAETTPEIDIA